MDVKIIECPRDAMQGMSLFVPTKTKIEYLNALLKVGYHTLDCGSFVSPQAIPQMRDTQEVLDNLEDSSTRLSVIVANRRGVNDAVKHDRVQYLGYPFSISETFQQRNTNKSIADSFDMVKYLLDKSTKNDKEVVIYISMGFGNPYGDDWNVSIVEDWVGKLTDLGIDSFSISDTVGISTPSDISNVFNALIGNYGKAEFGAHFHTRPDEWQEKIDSAYKSGCRRFDGAIKGYGGCPMAKDELVGNMPTENMVTYFDTNDVTHGLDAMAFDKALQIAQHIFN
jgi:hydroxymethylglutaryl-CoA lyase